MVTAMKNRLIVLSLALVISTFGCEKQSSPAKLNEPKAVSSAQLAPRGELKDMMVLSDLYGICTSRTLPGAWTTYRWHDVSSGTRSLKPGGVEHKISMSYGVDSSLPLATLSRIPNANDSKDFEISVGSNKSTAVLFASGIGKAAGLTMQIDYSAGDSVAADSAMSVAATLVPCEARNLSTTR
jgi:hypothetical protein